MAETGLTGEPWIATTSSPHADTENGILAAAVTSVFCFVFLSLCIVHVESYTWRWREEGVN